MDELLSNEKSGKKIILLGGEATVRGALESGVEFVSTYPGTPASDIGNLFYALRNKSGAYFEWSVNEKVALEAALGAAFSGMKTMVAMKNFGLNVCSDSLIPAMYTGIKGSLVLIVADYVSCWSSAQSEQNSRAYTYLGHIPTLEPSDAQECIEFTKAAFQLSEKFKIPVMVRMTTRVVHQKMPVKIGEIKEKKEQGKIVEFQKDPLRFVTLPPRVLEMKTELLEKIKRMQEVAESSNLNFILPGSKKKLGIIASGISLLYVMEAMKELKISLPILKIGFFYPLPEEKIKSFIKKLDKVLVTEELEPYLEKEIAGLAKEVNPRLKIYGKNVLPEVNEFRPEIMLEAFYKFLGKALKKPKDIKLPMSVKRFPRFCPNCPYWLVFNAIKNAVDIKKVIFGGDIGCYMLFGRLSVNMQDYLISMGASIGIAHGIKKVSDQKLITFIGDSTFFHAGIPALINTVFNKSNPLIIILNNQTTAMTGHQPHPATPLNGETVNIESVVKSLGVKNVKAIDPTNQEEFTNTVKEFLEKKEVSVIIAQKACALFIKK